jgi:hypothetical protein
MSQFINDDRRWADAYEMASMAADEWRKKAEAKDAEIAMWRERAETILRQAEEAEVESADNARIAISRGAEIAALKGRIEALENGAVHTGKVLREADTEIARLREALHATIDVAATLRGALGPFANFALAYRGNPSHVLFNMSEFLTHADLQRAIAALEENK